MLATLDLSVLQILPNWFELDNHIAAARANRHRLMLVLAMDLDQGHNYAQQVQQAIGDCLWVNFPTLSGVASITASQATQMLGSNRLAVAYNAHDEFNASAFSALAGTIEAGGVMILLTPSLDQWIVTHDQQLAAYGQPCHGCVSLFKRWWVDQWKNYSAVYLYAPKTNVIEASLNKLTTQPIVAPKEPIISLLPTQDQQQIVDALKAAYEIQQPIVYCLNAPRGRGKSTCLGWVISAIDEQLIHGPVIVTAPSKRALSSMQLAVGEVPIDFWALDALLSQRPLAGMLIIDEAAAVPLSQLSRLAEQYRLLVLSSTRDGYEGSGQGYRLKLPRLLAQLNLDTCDLSLAEPMRWSAHDPLEAMLKRSLLCDQQVDPEAMDQFQLSAVGHQQVAATVLTQNQYLLRQVYGLLMLSHYQTTPQDLRQLLDHTTSQIHLWLHGTSVVGVVWISVEGGLGTSLSHQIESGQRRISGHLLAQVLAQQAGFGEAARLCSWRVQRIAVLPKLQRQGLGSVMLDQLRELAFAQQVDYLGASFATDPSLIRFWNYNQYQAVWLGLTTDAATGLNSIQYMHPLSAPAMTLLEHLRSHLRGYLRSSKTTWFSQLCDQPWFCLLDQELISVPTLELAQQIRLLHLLAHGSANIYAGVYILEQKLINTDDYHLLVKTIGLSKKDYQKQVRSLAIKQVL